MMARHALDGPLNRPWTAPLWVRSGLGMGCRAGYGDVVVQGHSVSCKRPSQHLEMSGSGPLRAWRLCHVASLVVGRMAEKRPSEVSVDSVTGPGRARTASVQHGRRRSKPSPPPRWPRWIPKLLHIAEIAQKAITTPSKAEPKRSGQLYRGEKIIPLSSIAPPTCLLYVDAWEKRYNAVSSCNHARVPILPLSL